MTSKRLALLALLCTVGPLSAQSTSGALIAGSGYAIPPPDIAVAPGQIITVSIYGIPARTLDTVRMIGTGNLLAALNSGISAELDQTANPRQIAVPVYAVQQPKCLDPFSPCTPVTTVTVRIPFDMLAPADEFNIASLKIFDQGKSVGELALRPVADNIHFGNLCDQTAIMVSASPSGNAGCIPLLQHTNGSLVTAANPARWGEVVLGWAYGLGNANPSGPSGLEYRLSALAPTAQTFALGFNLQPNAAPNRPLARLGAASPAWTGIQDGTGLYHVNFVLPAVAPTGQFLPCDGVEVRSNLTITLAGAKSMDGAAICVAP